MEEKRPRRTRRRRPPTPIFRASSTRHAPYVLVRLTLVNVAKHACLRWLERTKTTSERDLFRQTRDALLTTPETLPLPN